MHDSDVDELGPVDYVVVEFPAAQANFSGEMAAELTALVKSGAVRVLDLLFLRKNPDGSVEGFESHEFGDGDLGELRALETELAMLLAEEDVESIGAALEPGSVAAVLVWENCGLRRSVPPCGGQGASSWPVAGSRSRRWRPRWRQMRQPRRKESEMLGRGRAGRPGVLGGRPVARPPPWPVPPPS